MQTDHFEDARQTKEGGTARTWFNSTKVWQLINLLDLLIFIYRFMVLNY